MLARAKLVTTALLLFTALPSAYSYDSRTFPSSISLSRDYNVVESDDGVPQLEPWEVQAKDPANVLDTPAQTPDAPVAGDILHSSTEPDDQSQDPLSFTPQPQIQTPHVSTAPPKDPELLPQPSLEEIESISPSPSSSQDSQVVVNVGSSPSLAVTGPVPEPSFSQSEPEESAGPLPSPSSTPSFKDQSPNENGDGNGDGNAALIPLPGDDFTCIFFGEGTLDQFLSPDPLMLSGSVSKFFAPQTKFPSLSPQYLSHTYGSSWGYSVPAKAGSSYEFVLGFAEIYDQACTTGAGFRTFSATLGDQTEDIDVMADVGCGKPLKKVFSSVSSSNGLITAEFKSTSQKAMLSTMCFRQVDGGTDGNNSPSQPPVPLPSEEIEYENDIVFPDDEYQCINFGPQLMGDDYTPYDPDSILGDTKLYNGTSVVQNPNLLLPYHYHVFGKSWTYQLMVPTGIKQRIVLGFAEIYPTACESGNSASFRVFTVSVANQVRIVDVMKSVGCGVIEQVAFEEVAPQDGLVEISFAAMSGDAMLSVICFKDTMPIDPEPSQEANPDGIIPTALPPAPDSPSSSPEGSPSPKPTTSPEAKPSGIIATPVPPGAPSASPTPEATDLVPTSCFKFGEGDVNGFGNVLVNDLGNGVKFFSKPSAIIKGTPYSSVYSSHIYGASFTLRIYTESSELKSVVLGFAEIFQKACETGFRVFNVTAGGVKKTIDVYDEVGCNTAFDLRFDAVPPSAEGTVDIQFNSLSNSAMLSAVCIFDDITSPGNAGPSKLAPKGPNAESFIELYPSSIEVLPGDTTESTPDTNPSSEATITPSVEKTSSPTDSEISPTDAPDMDVDGMPAPSAIPSATPSASPTIEISDHNSTKSSPSPIGDGGVDEEVEGSWSPRPTPSASAQLISPTAMPPQRSPESSAAMTPSNTADEPIDVSIIPESSSSPTPSSTKTISSPPDFPMPKPETTNEPSNEGDVRQTEEPIESFFPLVTAEPTKEPTMSQPIVTAIPPPPSKDESTPSETVQPSPGGITIEVSGPDGEEEANPEASPEVGTPKPSPIGNRQPPEILPPIESPPGVTTAPSETPVASPSAPQDGPTVTPTPVATSTPSPTAASTPEVDSVAPSPEPTTSPNTDESNPTDGPSPTPSTSSVSSTTGSDDVIVIGTTAPSPEPKESIPAIAPPDPISGVPEEDEGIEITDGDPNDDTINPDATTGETDGRVPTIVTGEYKDLIGTKSRGNGFAVGMGILGTLLVLLLLTCLYFAIFRSRGDTYTYSSQYSGRKPTDYEPSQGGYTDELGPGTGDYRNDYMYGAAGGQDGYGEGGTMESRPQTQNGSFTYEGATEFGGVGGSGYGPNDPGLGGSSYGNTGQDTFEQYSTVKDQDSEILDASRTPGAADITTINNTITMPASAFNKDTDSQAYDTYEHSMEIGQSTDQVMHTCSRPTSDGSRSSGELNYNAHRYDDQLGSHILHESRASQYMDRGNVTEVLNDSVRRDSNQTLSMGSEPAVGESPYETMHMDIADGRANQGNRFLRNRAYEEYRAAAVRQSYSTDSQDMDQTGEFLSKHLQENMPSAQGGHEIASGLRQSQVSNDSSPWPWWWSDKRKGAEYQVELSRGDESAQFVTIAGGTDDNDDDDYNDRFEERKENLGGDGVLNSIFRHGSTQSDLSGALHSPLENSSRENILPGRPSHILPDNGWQRQSGSDRGYSETKSMEEENPYITELRRRREPQVKSVANRLSYGPKGPLVNVESSYTEETEDEGEHVPLPSGIKNSSSWITRGSLRV